MNCLKFRLPLMYLKVSMLVLTTTMTGMETCYCQSLPVDEVFLHQRGHQNPKQPNKRPICTSFLVVVFAISRFKTFQFWSVLQGVEFPDAGSNLDRQMDQQVSNSGIEPQGWSLHSLREEPTPRLDGGVQQDYLLRAPLQIRFGLVLHYVLF